MVSAEIPHADPWTARTQALFCVQPKLHKLGQAWIWPITVYFVGYHHGSGKEDHVAIDGIHRTVLGIDAAWTLTNPSGIALIAEIDRSWRLLSVASSYAAFHALRAGEEMTAAHVSATPDVAALLKTCTALAGGLPDLIAIDMPLSRLPISGRRTSDDLLSRAYGGRGAGTHTPSAVRPGKISDDLRTGFNAAGYALRVGPVTKGNGLIEVYPHPALIELMRAPRRLPYKASKVRLYWPDLTPAQRRAKLFAGWAEIVAALDREISGVAARLPPLGPDASGREAKAYEDALDAIVCAWIGACVLTDRAASFGNSDSAIWVPHPGASVAADLVL